MKIIFFGSSDFSLPLLEACLQSGQELALVVTTPDQKKGRGLKVQSNPVKLYCEKKQIAFIAPDTLRSPESLEPVKALHPHLFVVASYGKIIPNAWLDVPSVLKINVHPSLLPKYRGASPLNWPILDGENETGLSLAEITSKLDAGDIFFQQKVSLGDSMDSERLSSELAKLGAAALQGLLKETAEGRLPPRRVQEEAFSSYARKLEKEDGRVRLTDPAEAISRKIRGLKPWPGAFMMFQSEPLALLAAHAEKYAGAQPAGTLLEIRKDGSILIQTAQDALQVISVKPAGRGSMSAADFARGRRLEPGFSFLSAESEKLK